MIRAGLVLVLLAAPALADEKQAEGGTLRVLDRMTDKVQDLHLAKGGADAVGKLTVSLDECRYPEGEPAGSIAHLTITEESVADPVFAGWMSAASPALNPLDHPRYDVWLLTCDTPAVAEPAPDAG